MWTGWPAYAQPPRLFPTGLAAPGEGKKFGGDTQTGVFDKWDTLGGAQARADALVDAANKRLTEAGVPPIVKAVLYTGDSPSEKGAFHFPEWTTKLNRLLLNQPGLDQAAAADLANTVYHETRHSEQWFMMARLRAGQGLLPAAIAAELNIPGEIAIAAKASPIRAGTIEAVVATGCYQSVY